MTRTSRHCSRRLPGQLLEALMLVMKVLLMVDEAAWHGDEAGNDVMTAEALV